MIRTALFLLLGASLVQAAKAAQAQDLPSPLFCITVELCQDAETCQPLRNSPPFVLRQTEGEWLMVFAPRGSDAWVIVAETAEEAVAIAPEGARIAAITVGTTPDGRIILHEHLLEDSGLNARFARHWCETSDGATS